VVQSRGDWDDLGPYELGIDLGTSSCVAAISRGGVCRVATLGTSVPEIPSTVFISEDGRILVGEEAEALAVTDQSRAVRGFKSMIGRSGQVTVGGETYHAEKLAAELIGGVVDKVSSTQNGLPERIAITCPGGWSQSRVDRLHQACWTAGFGDVVVISEPEAAAIRVDDLNRLVVGSNIAVFYLGDGDFSATIFNRTSTGFRLVGEPQTVEGLGVTINEGTIGFILALLGDRVERIDPDDPEVIAAVARLGRALTDAKRKLSVDEGAALPVTIPSSRTTLWLTRSRFEQILAAHVDVAFDAMRRAVDSAMLAFDQIDLIVLAGENTQIPYLKDRVKADFRCAVGVEGSPGFTCALGAARAAGAMPAGQSFELSPPTGANDTPAATSVSPEPPRPRSRLSRSAKGKLSIVILVVLLAEIGLLIGLLIENTAEQQPEPISRVLTSPLDDQ